MLTQLKKCLFLLPRELRWRGVALIAMLLLTAMLEALGAAAVFGLVRIVTDPTQLSTMPIVSSIIPWLPRQDARTIILSLTALVALFYVGKNTLLATTDYLHSRSFGEATALLSTRLLKGYLDVPYAFHLRHNSGRLIHTAHKAVSTVFDKVMVAAVSIATEVLVVIGIATILFVTAPYVTLLTGTVLLGVSLLLLRLTRSKAIGLGKQIHALSERSLLHLQQALGAIKEAKVLGRQRFFEDVYAAVQNDNVRVRYRYALLSVLPRILIETAFVLGALMVIVLVTVGGGTGPERVSLLGLYAYAGFRIIPSTNRILWRLNEFRHGQAAVDRVYDDILVIRKYTKQTGPSVHAGGLVRRVDLENVTYSYEGAETPALRNINLTIYRGDSIGVVGPTGSGKSTLVDLIVGLLEPSSGRIKIDGADMRDRLSSWQHQIGYVPQFVFLIDDSLRRNIALGIAPQEIDEERVWAAARLTQLDEMIRALPNGLDTTIGERGVRLSGGERQRVGIARALYGEPQVLVFDEATAALDNRTEAEVNRAVEALRGEKTLILIAHRLSTVRRCDRLVFIRDGCIAGLGSFDELLERNAEFRNMATTDDVDEPAFAG